MKVCEVVQSMMELNQQADILFTKRSDSEFIYLVSSFPDGKRVCLELPTGVERKRSDEGS